MNRKILALALPAIINNITVPLLGLCDTAIAGHLGSAAYIGAMSVGAMMLNVIYWLCGFLRMGTSGLTAQAYGAADADAMHIILVRALKIGLVIALAAICLQRPLRTLFLMIIAPEQAVASPASLYFSICIWAAPAQLGIMAASGWFIGRQNTVIPMAVAIGVNIVNILLSLLLVFVCHIGFAGIAIGTLTASWIGLAAILLLAFRQMQKRGLSPGSPISEEIRSGRKVAGIGEFFKVSTDLFFRSACIMGVTFAMTTVGARLGETTLAANAVMMQFFLFFSYFMDGFAFAGEALVGRAVGGGDLPLLSGAVRGLLRWGAAMAAIFFLFYLLLTPAITRLLTDSPQVVDAVVAMKVTVYTLPPITVAAFIFDGIFIGLARTRPLLVTTLIAAAVFFITAFLAPGAGNLPDNSLLWCAFDAYLLLRGILLGARYLKYPKKSLIL